MLERIVPGLAPRAVDPAEAEGAKLRQRLAQVRLQLDCAQDLFNTATDEAMLDSCIYEMQSLQVYYSFLVRQLRQLEADALPREADKEAGLLPGKAERVMEAMG